MIVPRTAVVQIDSADIRIEFVAGSAVVVVAAAGRRGFAAVTAESVPHFADLLSL